MEQQSLYDEMGGQMGIETLVRRFYHWMDTLAETRGIRAMHPADLAESRDKLVAFLSGWSGGPPLYHLTYGNPMLRARHLRFPIGESESAQWMHCMEKALAESGWSTDLQSRLMEALWRVARHMQNRASGQGEPSERLTDNA